MLKKTMLIVMMFVTLMVVGVDKRGEVDIERMANVLRTTYFDGIGETISDEDVRVYLEDNEITYVIVETSNGYYGDCEIHVFDDNLNFIDGYVSNDREEAWCEIYARFF